MIIKNVDTWLDLAGHSVDVAGPYVDSIMPRTRFMRMIARFVIGCLGLLTPRRAIRRHFRDFELSRLTIYRSRSMSSSSSKLDWDWLKPAGAAWTLDWLLPVDWLLPSAPLIWASASAGVRDSQNPPAEVACRAQATAELAPNAGRSEKSKE